MGNIQQSTNAYENWLRAELGGEIVEKDLDRKHEKMRDNPFAFLRATYWRWAETVLEICPDLVEATRVLAVGDIHLENYGTWRDVDGRLVWGVNDFDEAAEMPFALDLVRLATSALVADKLQNVSLEDICVAILKGYRGGLTKPQPLVLDRDWAWLRTLVVVSEKERAKFWKKIEAAPQEPAPERYHNALMSAMPERSVVMTTARRVVGAGSLGRPRWVGRADWRGGPIVREAKALLVSSWYRTNNPHSTKIHCAEIASARYRAQDPWYAVTDNMVVRRISPNNRKIETDDDAFSELTADMLRAMGQELANAHLGTADCASTIMNALGQYKQDWLTSNAKKMADATKRDYQAYRSTA
jgi:Uncharacterized protein conserved in bacteria (DUF2252)